MILCEGGRGGGAGRFFFFTEDILFFDILADVDVKRFFLFSPHGKQRTKM